jgi:8-oxo-dGTP pyrophosphatase MutT (NUDIX family)
MRAHEFTDQGAAGIVLYAEDTGRYGLQQRSETVGDPGLWAAWGGGREPGESLEQCARRELAEEGGYTGPIELERLGENSRYVTFLGRVPHEFEPRADSEWQDYCWVEAGDWPGPMHPGTAAALQNIHKDTVNEKINRDIRNRRFEHSQQIGDYTYKATVEIFMGSPLLWIKAYHGKKEIGHILFELYSDHLQSGGTEVDPNYRNKGVASTMYAYAKMLGNDIKPSFIRTDQGKGMWTAWEKSGDAKHLGPEVKENFADGKNPGRKGLSKRVGVNTKASVSSLRKTAKNSSGEKQRMAHWLANMKAGRAKAKRK